MKTENPNTQFAIFFLSNNTPILSGEISERDFRSRDEKFFNYLIDHGADVNGIDEKGNTPLHCMINYPNLVRLLLSVSIRTISLYYFDIK